MEKVLNQEQIDAMVRAARGGAGGAGPAGQAPVAVRWDVRQAGQIGKDQVQAISNLHEGFARNLTHSVGPICGWSSPPLWFRPSTLPTANFCREFPKSPISATCKLSPVDAVALLQLDLAVAFPLIDVLLGGEGKSARPERQITGIEEQILETVMSIICRELQNAWQMLSLQVEFEQRQQPEQVEHLMPAEEKTLSLSFELIVAESRGTLSLVFPAVVSNALLRKMTAEWSRPKRRPQPEASERLRTHLLDCPFRVQLGLKVPSIPVQELVSSRPAPYCLCLARCINRRT